VERRPSAFAASQRHNLVSGETARRRAPHPLEAAWLDRASADRAQESATVLSDLKIDFASWIDPEAVTNRLRDCDLALARHRHRHFRLP
jgi:hypothetical protein